VQSFEHVQNLSATDFARVITQTYALCNHAYSQDDTKADLIGMRF
jgi:hypothetical protein